MLGFMCGCAFLSMWVNNTSAVTMVMPIVDAVITQVLKAGDEEGAEPTGIHNPALELDGGSRTAPPLSLSSEDELTHPCAPVSSELDQKEQEEQEERRDQKEQEERRRDQKEQEERRAGG